MGLVKNRAGGASEVLGFGGGRRGSVPCLVDAVEEGEAMPGMLFSHWLQSSSAWKFLRTFESGVSRETEKGSAYMERCVEKGFASRIELLHTEADKCHHGPCESWRTREGVSKAQPMSANLRPQGSQRCSSQFQAQDRRARAAGVS